MSFIIKKALQTILTLGLNYLIKCLVKSKWLHFKLLSLVKPVVGKTETKADDWALAIVKYGLEKWHEVKPLNETDKLIIAAILTAIAKDKQFKDFTFTSLEDVKKQLNIGG